MTSACGKWWYPLWLVGVAACALAGEPESSGLNERPPNAACRAFTAPPTTGPARLVERFPDVKPNVPTGLVQRPGDNTRWYVLERGGRILHFPNRPNPAASEVKVALDLTAVTFADVDCSLASLAFPPDFATSKRAYVSYCYKTPANQLQVRVSRFATNDGGATFDRASEELLVTVNHPGDAAHVPVGLHGAGAIRFGPDGYLYVAIGDGSALYGSLGGMHSQDKTDLRGKLLRIDVSDPTKKLVDEAFVPGSQRVGAAIPADNPFVAGGGHGAVYAYGLRNPWQWHFDRATGAIWLGDVGASNWEEVNRNVAKGGNYGWAVYEGTHCTQMSPGACSDPAFLPPLLDYDHGTGPQQGNAVTGGVVYRGSAVPSLKGAYIFGDSSVGHIWAVRDVDGISATAMPPKELLFDGVQVSAFAEDQNGEVFVVSLAGKILALEEMLADPDPALGGPPPLLSQTGCFDPANDMAAMPDLVPFAPNAELWSDGATKQRWMTIPDGKTITALSDGDFEFPPGSVLIKEFRVGGKKVETRFFVRQESDEIWAGYSYRWNEEQSDATLVGAGGDVATYGGQVWNFPSRAQCHQCHTPAAGHALGPEIAQLNHTLMYPATGRIANQVFTLEKVGLLNTSGVSKPWSKLPGIAQGGSTVNDQARAYLHVNCSNCHRPNGPTFTPPDFRFSVALSEMGICDAQPTISVLEDFIPSEARLLAPGEPGRSVLFVRLSTEDARVRMPPIARTITHPAGAKVIADWITQTTACP